MSRRIEDMKNLGPVMARKLAEIDVHDEDDLRALGVVDAYRRLKFVFGREINIVALYALEAAIRGCHWLDIDAETKDRLRHIAEQR